MTFLISYKNFCFQLNIKPNILSEKYEKEFFEDLKRLNVLPPLITPKVSQYIPNIISFVEKIMDKGFAYHAGGLLLSN